MVAYVLYKLPNTMKKESIIKEIDDIKNQLVEKYRPEKIILFGSATREGKEVNDIDLLIIKKMFLSMEPTR